MASRRSGFTLLEVLVALLVITTALLGLAGTLGPVAALAGQGRLKGRIALVLESRLDRLRAELLGAAECRAPAPGREQHADGIVEVWSTRATPGGIELLVSAGPSGSGALDSVLSRIPCP